MKNLFTTKPDDLEDETERHALLLADWQKRVISEGRGEIKTNIISAWAQYDSHLDDFFVEGMRRTPDKIYRAFFRSKTLDYEDLMKEFTIENPASRPAQLGDTFNGFWNTCTLAFYLDYCRRFCLDASELVNAAYGETLKMPEDVQTHIIEHADWEGISYPDAWNCNELKQLQLMLTNINYHQLRDEIQNLEELGVFEKCKTIEQQPSLLTMKNSPKLSA